MIVEDKIPCQTLLLKYCMVWSMTLRWMSIKWCWSPNRQECTQNLQVDGIVIEITWTNGFGYDDSLFLGIAWDLFVFVTPTGISLGDQESLESSSSALWAVFFGRRSPANTTMKVQTPGLWSLCGFTHMVPWMRRLFVFKGTSCMYVYITI